MTDTPMVRVTKKTQVFANPQVGTKPGWRLQLSEQIIGETITNVVGEMNAPAFGRTFNIKLKSTPHELGAEFQLPLASFKVKEREFTSDSGETKTALWLYPLG